MDGASVIPAGLLTELPDLVQMTVAGLPVTFLNVVWVAAEGSAVGHSRAAGGAVPPQQDLVVRLRRGGGHPVEGRDRRVIVAVVVELECLGHLGQWLRS